MSTLGLAWYFDLDTNRGQEATPLLIDGTLYFTSALSKVFAVDARTGKEKWRHVPKVAGEKAVDACCDVVDAAQFRSIVLDGILAEKGMVSFASVLNPQEAEGVRTWLVQQAGLLMKPTQ